MAPLWVSRICSGVATVSRSWRSSANPSSPKSGSNRSSWRGRARLPLPLPPPLLRSLCRGRINRRRLGSITGLPPRSPAPNEGKRIPTPHGRHPSRPSSHAAQIDIWLGDPRKNQQKKVVCHVPAAGLSSDVWAWRKYGQKPIKGSPYPRCSSSKGCLARKQVERSRTDPGMFIITYTAEHNHPVPTHRNSLAGSTRHKFPSTTPAAPAGEDGSGGPTLPGNASSSPPSSSTAAGLSPNTPLTASMEDELLRRPPPDGDDADDGEDEEVDEDEEMLLVEDMEVMGEDDLLFMGGAEESSGPAAAATSDTKPEAAAFFGDDGELGDHFFQPPWLSKSNNAAAAAGGS
ncbi:hypothetical protein GW17_00001481 [Ensete ventricosum]|nr:hypothetical protein GW17_00001481 [Ensete ventricosum]RZS27549.1 hypothetical protein BHM03_00061051 [Ensete ventricosum]